MKRIFLMTCWLAAAWPAAVHSQEAASLTKEGLFQLKPLFRLGELRWRAGQEIHALAFAPDGKTLAVAGGGSIGIWDVASAQRVLERKKNPWKSYNSLAWTPDGALIAAGQDRDVLVWDSAGKERAFSWHKFVVRKIELSADGTVLASLDSAGHIKVGDVATGKVKGQFKCPELWSEMALAPNAKLLATNGPVREPIQIWDVATGQRLRVLTDKATYTKHLKLAFGADSRRLISADEGDLRIWDVTTGELLREIKKAFTSFPWNLVVAPDGKRCAHDSSETIKVWNLADGTLHRTLEAPGQYVRGLAFSADSKTIATASNSAVINLWDAETGRCLTAGDGHTVPVEAVAWVTPKRVVTTGRDRSFRYWDAAAGRLDKVVAVPAGLLQPRALTPDGAVVIGNNAAGGIGVFDVASGMQKAAVPSAGNWLVPFVPSPRGTLAAFHGHRPPKVHRVLLVSTEPSRPERVIEGPDRAIRSLAISPDEKLVAIGYEQKYDGEFPRQAVIRGPVKIPPRRKDPTIFLYEVATGREVQRFGESLTSITALAFAPNSRLLVAADEHRLHVLDLETGKLSSSRQTTTIGSCEMVLSRDGRLLSSPETGLWETATLSCVARLEGHGHRVETLAFSPDGRRALTGSADTTAAIWDLTVSQRGTLPKLQLTPPELRDLWEQLRSMEAGQFYPALWKLVAAGDAGVSLVRKHIQPAPHLDPEKVKAWFADIDHELFTRRDEAVRQLELHGPAIEADVMRLLSAKSSLEKQRRLERLLAAIGPTPERIRAHRSLMVLEQVGSPAAQALLAELAKGEPRDPLTREAEESLGRLRGK